MDRIEQAKQIAAGLTHYLRSKVNLADFEIEELHQKRMALCDTCPDNSKDIGRCRVCGCFLALKTRSIHSSCPLDNW
jgi:hypothetical protein